MKIVYSKENNVKKVLEHLQHLLEAESIDYPILEDDLVLNISLKDMDGNSCPKNGEIINFTEKDLKTAENSINVFEYYYNHDALTKLYNRGKYERDIVKLPSDKADEFTCIYIDAVGLHEINNHLGHAAGDHMLCSIADGIRNFFADSSAYRIGGDEFVIFCFCKNEKCINQSISDLKNMLRQEEYEISVGMAVNSKNTAFIETINHAEQEMRSDKTRFYRSDAAKRQMRNLNYKLEKILLEKQDTSQFLNVIASEYKGVYMVNPDNDTCRYIYIPEYFENILAENNGIFSKSIRAYCDKFVCDEDKELFRTVFDFSYVLEQIKQGKQIGFLYRKKDGSKVYLQITIYSPDSSDIDEMLWIFMDGNSFHVNSVDYFT